MGGSFVTASQVIYHAVESKLRRVRHPFFILFLVATGIVQLLIFAAPTGKHNADPLQPSALHAAALQAPLACQELLVNGNLEASGGWTFAATAAPGTIVDAPVHAGAFAIRLGIASGTNAVAYSTAYQTIALPAAAEQIVLTYWERPGTTGDSADYREVLALRPNLSVLRSLERITGAGNDAWTQRSFDVSDLRGQSIVLYFNVYNNGSGATLVNYLDDLSLQSCDSAATATATATEVAVETATPTATATTVVTPTTTAPTPTATPLPSNVIVRAGNVAVTEGQTTLTAPLDLLGASAERAVGVLSVDVQYDATLLTATTCTVGDSFDLLLCNLATPGMIQLAGVAATGIHSDVRIADLAFTVLQPANLNTQLTVQLDTVADANGAALSATAQNGQIGDPCLPGNNGCLDIYLPLVQR